MTNTLQRILPHRGPVAKLFAAALDGDCQAEHALRDLARTDFAADALSALASCQADDAGQTNPANVAATDQMIAAVLEAVPSGVQQGGVRPGLCL